MTRRSRACAFIWPLLAAALLAPLPAWSQVENACDARAVVDETVQPADKYSRSLQGGDLRLALVRRPGDGGLEYYLALLTPPADGGAVARCRLIGHTGATGFRLIAFDAMTLRDDPARGLTIELPVMAYDRDTSRGFQGMLGVAFDGDTGATITSLTLFNE